MLKLIINGIVIFMLFFHLANFFYQLIEYREVNWLSLLLTLVLTIYVLVIAEKATRPKKSTK